MVRKAKTVTKKKTTTGFNKKQRRTVGKLALKAVRRAEEVKYKDVKGTVLLKRTQGATSLGNGNIAIVANAAITPAAGDNGQRIGDKIRLRSMHITAALQPMSAYSGTSNIVRVMLIKIPDVSWYDETTWYSQILQTGNNGITGMIDHYNHDNRRKFNVVFDKTFRFDQASVETGVYRKKISLKNTTVLYSSGGTTPIKNEYVMIAWSEGDYAAGLSYNMNYHIRLNYAEI